MYHAFSGRIPVGDKHSLNPTKLENVVCGRLRKGEGNFRHIGTKGQREEGAGRGKVGIGR